jgi:pimeloyl-ACP methyl ester carboxylesterase
MQNHYISGNLRKPKKKRAYWAIRPTGTAVIFVHGLMGEAVGTWSNFEGLLLRSSKCQGCDLIFYKYNSIEAQTHSSSALLYEYLDELLTTPAVIVNKDAILGERRATDFKYKKVILVAHSLGSIICRQALLEANTAKDDWRGCIELVLFAPAHLGATDIEDLVTEIASIFSAKWVVSGAKVRWPVLKDLRKGSDLLNKLASGTREAIEGGKADFLRAKKVVFGEFDRVVVIDNFCGDARLKVFAGKGHRSVCKPNDTFLDPVKAVLEFL